VPRIIKTLRTSCVWTVVLLIPRVSTAQTSALHITVISGEDAAHPAGAHVTKPITIEVTDAAGQPVEGARTSFQMPEDGPTGVSSSGLRTDLAVTDSRGRATLRGFQLNRTPGPFNVRVTVVKEQARAGIVVRQRIGEESASTGSADRRTQPTAVTAPAALSAPTAANAPAATVPNVTETKTNAVPAKAALGNPRTAGAATPKAIEASMQPVPASRQTITETTPSVAASTPTRMQTIIITQSSPKTSGGLVAASGGKSHKKWVWLGILAAGGVAGAFAGSSLSAASAAHGTAIGGGLNSSVSIGTPTITIGKP